MDEYKSLLDSLSKSKNDNEINHMTQDKIYRKFIRDICYNKLKSIEEIQIVAKTLKKEVVNYDRNRWYS
jgi:hypothetical protein